MRTSRILCLGATLCALLATSAQAAPFKCSASAARVTVLGQAAEPVTANTGTAACASASQTLTGPAAGFAGPLTIGALVASTEVFPAQKSVVATGGVADLKVSALPSLPITLPQVAVPAALTDAIAAAGQTSVDLTPVKAVIPPVPDVVQNAANTALNAANAATNAANVALNVANAAWNAANALLILADPSLALPTNLPTNLPVNLPTNLVLNPGAVIPDSISINVSATLNAALADLLPSGQLPTAELLRVQGAIAYAAGACKSGSAVVSGSSTVTGLSVFGQNLPVGAVVDQLLTLVQTGNVDPSNLTIPAIDLGLTQEQRDLIATIPAAQAALDAAIAAVRDVIQAALDAIPATKVLDPTVAQVKVTPGVRIQDATSVTQRALTVEVSIAGQKIVEAIIGEAKASSAGVDCSEAVTDPADGVTPPGDGVITVPGIDAPIDTNTPEGALLQCSTRRLVLIDVLERGNRVKLTGVADPALSGKKVAIVFDATGDTVAHARIAKDGSFDTTAPLPPPRLRDTNDARYMATLGKEESINLKLRRRMIIKSMTADNGKVTISGRVLPPLAAPLKAITLTRRVSCTEEKVVTRFKPDPDGRFRVTVTAPKGVGAAVYRMTTEVRFSAAGSALFKTYTLPRAVELTR